MRRTWNQNKALLRPARSGQRGGFTSSTPFVRGGERDVLSGKRSVALAQACTKFLHTLYGGGKCVRSSDLHLMILSMCLFSHAHDNTVCFISIMVFWRHINFETQYAWWHRDWQETIQCGWPSTKVRKHFRHRSLMRKKLLVRASRSSTKDWKLSPLLEYILH